MIGRFAALAVIAFALHFVWEMAHASLYTNMRALSFRTATAWCARAALVDVAISSGSYAVAALLARHLRWPRNMRPVAFGAYVAFGLLVAVAIERWAIAIGRWRYAPEMPTVAGIGLSPLLQWIVIPAGIVAAGRLIFGSEGDRT